MEQSDSSSAAKIYEEYLGRSIADPFTRVLLELAHPGKAERVLDLASGTGSVARHVAPMVGRQGRVVALDINPEMLAVGRALPQPQGAVIEWLEGDAVRIALPNSGFDLILCQQGLQFFRDRHAALVEMRRLLAPGGRVLISVWQALSRHPIYEALFKAVAGHFGLSISAFDVSFSLGSAEELRSLLLGGGFHDIIITARSLEVRLDSPKLFVQLTVQGAATSVPAFARLDAQARSQLVAAISARMEPIVARRSSGDTLTFLMHTNIAVARE